MLCCLACCQRAGHYAQRRRGGLANARAYRLAGATSPPFLSWRQITSTYLPRWFVRAVAIVYAPGGERDARHWLPTCACYCIHILPSPATLPTLTLLGACCLHYTWVSFSHSWSPFLCIHCLLVATTYTTCRGRRTQPVTSRTLPEPLAHQPFFYHHFMATNRLFFSVSPYLPAIFCHPPRRCAAFLPFHMP